MSAHPPESQTPIRPMKAGQVAKTRAAIGVDIGGTKVAAALVSQTWHADNDAVADETELTGFDREPTPDDTEGFIDAICRLIERVRAGATTPPEALGISTAGTVDPRKGEIIGATGNLPAIKTRQFPIKEILQARIDLSIQVENDANAAAYGEAVHGAAKGFTDVVMVTLGTGVGTGLVVNGNLVRGAHFSAGEGGHIAIAMDKSRLCTCGRWDCWETYASGTGVAETARRLLLAAPNARHSRLLAGNKALQDVTTHEIVEAWQAGNPIAIEVMASWHEHIAVGLGSVINLLDPQVLVIGGGMAKFVDFDRLKALTRPRAMTDKTEIVPATLGNQAGLVGAAALALESY